MERVELDRLEKMVEAALRSYRRIEPTTKEQGFRLEASITTYEDILDMISMVKETRDVDE